MYRCIMGEGGDDDKRVAAAEENVLSVDLEEKLGAENAAEFERRFAADGWVGAAWYECYLGDQTYLAGFEKVVGDDGLEHAPDEALLIPETDCDWRQEGVMLSYDEFETPLPEAVQDKESLTIARKVFCQMCWLIADGDKVYTGRGDAEHIELTFEIARSEDYVEMVYVNDAQFPKHTAAIELTCTPIRAEFTVTNQVSDEWKAIWDGYGGYLHAPLNLAKDVIFDYEILVDGEQVYCDETTFKGVEGKSGFFLLPTDAKQVTFRPVYANTAAHTDEDVVIDLAAQE